MGSRDVGLLQNAAVRLDKKHLDSFLALITIPLHSTRISRVNSFLKLSIYDLDKKVCGITCLNQNILLLLWLDLQIMDIGQ